MRRRIIVPLNEEKTVDKQTLNKSFLESANVASTINEGVDEPLTFEELKNGLNLLILIRDGYMKYKDFVATMSITEDGKINVGIYSEARNVYTTVTISGKGINDCEAAVDYAIEKVLNEIGIKEGSEINESLKHDIASGALGLAMLGFASGALSKYATENPEQYNNYVVSPEREERIYQQAERKKAERNFFISKEWYGMDSEHEGYVYDKIGDDENGGTLLIMVNRGNDQYESPFVRRLGVNADVYKNYNIGDYIDVYDVIGGTND